MNKVYRKTIEKFGVKHQKLKVIEELSELVYSLARSFHDDFNVYSLYEEMADVEIMLEQLKMIYDCNSDVELIKKEKIDRLKGIVL